jgi:NAD dependent epimerase/dehydratase family enzyme
MLGEMADVVLNSTRVIPEVLNQEEFLFNFDDPGLAVNDLFERKI